MFTKEKNGIQNRLILYNCLFYNKKHFHNQFCKSDRESEMTTIEVYISKHFKKQNTEIFLKVNLF